VDGVPTIDSDAFSFAYYRDILTNRLRSTWSRPLVPGGLQQAIRATVQFVVLRSGAITDVSVQESSGYPPLDRSALRSVFDANPLPPLPDPYEGNRLAVTFFFELTPER
jgi:protein TonB